MATVKGNEGIVTVGDNVVAEVKDWSISETAETIDATSMGDTARTKLPSFTSASGSMTAFWDITDVNGQGGMTVGTVVALKLYPSVTASTAGSGDDYATCSAIITEKGVSSSMDGMTETSVSFEVNGAVAWDTVS